MTVTKKVWKFLGSMRFAMILLFVLIAACAAGSFITQGQTWSWYERLYGRRAAGAIMALSLDDVFHSPWFLVITAFLCLNLLLCNILRFPGLMSRFRKCGMRETILGERPSVAAEAPPGETPEAFFRKAGFKKRISGSAGDGAVWAVKNRAGLWGAWVTHMGILLVILGFGFGQMLKTEYSVYGVAGESKQIGDTGYILSIDSFSVDLREDETVRQYTSEITVRKSTGGEPESASVSVNNPASLYGMKFYQNSTGWAADIRVEKEGKEIQKETVCCGDYLAVSDKPDLVIYLNAFYPDYVLDPDEGPKTASSEIKNPAYLYSVYYQGQMLGMNALPEEEKLTIDEYTVTFGSPQSYTLIQVKRDPFTPLALLGGLVTLLGLVLSFYIQHAWIRGVRREDGSWLLEGGSRKGGQLFIDRFREAAAESGFALKDGASRDDAAGQRDDVRDVMIQGDAAQDDRGQNNGIQHNGGHLDAESADMVQDEGVTVEVKKVRQEENK